MLIDTHAHLDDAQFDGDRPAVIRRAIDAGIAIITVGVDLASSRAAIALAEQSSGLYAAVGVHPHAANTLTPAVMTEIRSLCRRAKVVAVGETGLDYYRELAPRNVQRHAFDAHLALARDLDLPVIIHNRQADADVLALIKAHVGVRGVLHAFSSGMDVAKAGLDAGFYISFGGPLTYKNAMRTREVARQLPLDRIMLETDCPYLPPVPRRGQRNEPSYIVHIAEVLAGVRRLSMPEIAAATTANAQAVFRLPASMEGS